MQTHGANAPTSTQPGDELPRDLDGELADSIVDDAMRRWQRWRDETACLYISLADVSESTLTTALWRASTTAVLEAQREQRLPPLHTRPDGRASTPLLLFVYARLTIRVDGMRRA